MCSTEKRLERNIWKEVARRKKEGSARQANYYNLRRRPWTPKDGEMVWKKERCLSSALLGPLTTSCEIRPQHYTNESPAPIRPTNTSAQIRTPPVKLESAPIVHKTLKSETQIATIDLTISSPNNGTVTSGKNSATVNEELPTTSKAAFGSGPDRKTPSVNPTPPKPIIPKRPRFTEEQVFEGVKIYQPKKYTKHQQPVNDNNDEDSDDDNDEEDYNSYDEDNDYNEAYDNWDTCDEFENAE
ncbi:transcription initiation factor TFIID subunit 11-like [Calliphora vicina]|uniref:transcription initiation factor TFIID subunit 11-like n=1 Tax=Calliphora vicina TaxID=7373 RepID=UPI00325B0AEB